MMTALFVTIVAMTPNSILVPGLPLVADGLGVSRPAVNMLVTVYTVSSAVSAAFIGMAADRFGRKRVIIPALVTYAAGGIMPAVWPDYALALAGRVVQGVGGSGIMSSIYGLVGDASPDTTERNRMLGLISGTIAICEMAVPLVGGVLAAASWKGPFWGYGAALPAAALCLFTLPNVISSSDSSVDYASGLAATVSSPVILGTFLGKFGFSLAYFMLLTSAPFVVVSRLHGSSVLSGILMIPMGILWAVAAFSMPRLTSRYPIRILAVAGAVTQGIAVTIMAFTWSTSLMAAMFGLWGIGAGLFNPCLLAMSIESAGESYRGAISSMYGCVSLIGSSVGPIASAVLVLPSGDLAPAFIFAGAVMFACAWGFARLTSRRRREAAVVEV